MANLKRRIAIREVVNPEIISWQKASPKIMIRGIINLRQEATNSGIVCWAIVGCAIATILGVANREIIGCAITILEIGNPKRGIGSQEIAMLAITIPKWEIAIRDVIS
jgi:hypothetical protein